jgi:acyl carrier protein
MGMRSVEDKQEQRILQLIREVLPWQSAKKELRPEMSLQRDLGIDSLSKVALAVRFEEEFSIDLAKLADQIGEIRTVSDVLIVARRLINESAGT